MYRRQVVPHWVWGLPYCDLALHALHAPIGMVPQTLTYYRNHPESMFTSKSWPARLRLSIPVYRALATRLPEPYAKTARETYVLAQLGLGLLERSPSLVYSALFGGVPWPTLLRLFLGQCLRMLRSSLSPSSLD